jgi:peptide/nickel transport system substrate-binding protein
MRKLFTITLLLSITLLLLAPLQAQDSGSGIIIEGNPGGSGNITTFNPLRCESIICFQMGAMLFPNVLAVDPETATFIPATVESGGLVADWTLSDDGTQWTLTLLDGITWSDGTPITAYDVFFSYAVIQIMSSFYSSVTDATIEGVVPISDTQLVVITKEHTCDALSGMQFPVIPYHVYDREFAAIVADFFTGTDDILAQWQAWEDELPYSFGYLPAHPFELAPIVNYGRWRFDEWQRTEYIRLRSNSGDLVYEFRDTPSVAETTELFLSGELTVFNNFNLERWNEIVAAPDVQTYEGPNIAWDTIVFNLADPFEPASYRNPEDGTIQEQGVHPIFGDVRVRQAIQLGINVDEIIETALQGHGTPIYADHVPLSWAYDDSIAPIPYDRDAAARLLHEAGWYLFPGNTRVCVRCTTAEEGTRLAFTLSYEGSFQQQIAAIIIQRQLSELGISVNLNQGGDYSGQMFDAALVTRIENYPATPDRLRWFDPENDILQIGENVGSYYNHELINIYQQARETCDIATRRELYVEATRVLHADQPYVWLYAYHDLRAVSGSVQNFAPIPGAPYWNMDKWVVWE